LQTEEHEFVVDCAEGLSEVNKDNKGFKAVLFLEFWRVFRGKTASAQSLLRRQPHWASRPSLRMCGFLLVRDDVEMFKNVYKCIINSTIRM